ncbi:MAG: DUF2971 domain-containing protein [Chlorobi bacterium]|nr:DUF2971 domain-containing protein [Chlorobiota bacterium]
MKVKEKEETFKKEFNKLFPGIDVSQFLYGENIYGNEIINNINIPPENINLKNSPYFYKKTSVVHFSNFFAINSILNEKSIRLYNLYNLNDPREFTFASKIFNLKDEKIKDAKSNQFIISFCERVILKEFSNQFNMWRLYGQNGKGIAIVFSIANDPAKWIDFHISKVIYGSDLRQKFFKLLKLINQLNKSKPHIDIDFGKLYAFHKSKLFEFEKEVRILYDNRKMRTGMTNFSISFNNQHIFPNIKSDLFKLLENKQNIQCLKLPLYTNNGSRFDDKIPLLKIEQIIIGYNFEKGVREIQESLGDLCSNNLGYKPIIKQTSLTKSYWGIKND